MKNLGEAVFTACLLSFALLRAGAQQPAQTSLAKQSSATARQRWQIRGRAVAGENSADLRRRAILQKLQMRSARSAHAAIAGTGGGWTSLGPLPLPSDASGIGLQDYGIVSGRTTSVAIDPNDSSGNTVFAGGAYGGVWKSVNAGSLNPNSAMVTWSPLTDNQLTLAIGAIAVQPQFSNPDPSRSVVLAGTGETNGSVDSYYGLGILRSVDGGQNWTLISQDASGVHSFAGLGFSRIAFSSTNPALVVAGAASASEGVIENLESPVGANRGIYYSSDAGTSWNAATESDAGVSIAAASITSVVYNAAAQTFFAAIRFHGFYSSSDAIHWTRLPSQPGSGLTTTACPAQTAQINSCPIYRGEIAVVPNRNGPSGLGEMYVWFVDANDVDQGIWRTTNSGISWTQIDDSGITNCGDLFGGCGTEQGSYNLALAAVPNGTATDLYAGAVNLYKCTITNASPNCAGTGNNTFLNLTHVYGCSDIAKVHPDQHALDFLVSGGTALMYFANDGGIYRALDGFSGLTTGTCGLTNQFDNLNAALGPITQFVSIAESSTDPDLIFGGTQGNGAPATAFSQSGGSWVNVNAGDNGYTAINPANDNEWFVATPPDSASGVNLFRCANGVNCHTPDFAGDQVADSNDLGGDTGPFYLPFILDPASPETLLVGTCRVWRGPSTGGIFSLLSSDFETGGSGACSGTETNLVRSIAAGGPLDSNGYSQVIYAGTDGVGPLVPATPQGGHVWITTNADAGPTAWVDRTASINPQGFPISSIAIDPVDPTGQTAYVAVMGFHVSHLWKTTNAGASWTDFTGNLPDAPIDSIAVDSGATTANGTVYVGTDVGVFATSTASPSWAEIGPGANQAGFLPDVAVTSLQIFNSGGVKRLRAGTYGRGIWEWNLVTTPDFQVYVTNNPQTIFAGQSAVYNGAISAENGYTSSVSLNCVPGTSAPPQTCVTTPPSITPVPQGTAFSLSAAGTAGDYAFNLQAAGSDPANVTHTFALTLHVIDFSLTAPSPASVSVVPGGTSSPVSFSVSASGSFNRQVTLSCAGLPAGASCQFQPSSIVMPTAGNPIPISMTVAVPATASLSDSQITIAASTAGGPTKMQTLSLSVTAAPDYVLSISNASLTTQINTSTMFNGTLTALNGYNSTVALSCGTGAPPTCVVAPTHLVPGSSGSPFTVTVSSPVVQDYAFNINATGTDPSAIAHSLPVTFTSAQNQNFDFTLAVTPSSVSIASGQTATYSVSVSPTTGAFPSNVTFSCGNMPALTTCAFNPSQVPSGSGNSDITVTVSTTAPVPAIRKGSPFAVVVLPIGFLWIWGMLSPPGWPKRSLRRLFLLMIGLGLTVACGGGLQGNGTTIGTGSPGTPAGSYTIQISAASSTVSHSTQVSLTVTQQ